MRSKVLALLAIVVSVFLLASCGSSHGASVNKNPSSFSGEWRQVNSSPDGWMTASISGESIQVDLRGRDSTTLFWMGTFHTNKKPVGKFKVVSLGDQDAMASAIFASTEKRKTFSYNNGVLSFVFSMGKSSAVIHMKKVPTRTPSSTPTTHRPSNKPSALNRTPKAKSKGTVSKSKVSLGKKK